MIISTASWICLLIAIVFGVCGTVCMKLSDGFQKLKPSLYLILFYTISFAALTLAVQGVDIGIVYAVWSGIGTILVAIIGVVLFHEYISVKKVISLLFVVIGVVGINLSNAFH